MTYNVFSGTLNPTHSLTHSLAALSSQPPTRILFFPWIPVKLDANSSPFEVLDSPLVTAGIISVYTLAHSIMAVVD